ncbi:MAG: branched-chain amino acid ABC transporter permease [Gaiellaceae bacterium]
MSARSVTPSRVVGIGALVIAALGPFIFSNYIAHTLLTQVFWLGIAAASLTFLSAYGGMVSLCQISMFGIAGFVVGNTVTTGEVKGLHLGWNPWLGVVLGILIATAVGLLLGALSSRSFGIYFLMLTVVFAVLANYFFGQVTNLSGFSGISGIQIHTPGIIGNPNLHPNRLYYIALVTAIVVYFLIRYLGRTPFGIALQGIRDDPVRMSSLGYNISAHRTLAFGFAAFIASLAGVLFVWWNDHIDPATINLDAVINLLIVCVIGGLYKLEGAWVGALAFVLINNYLHDTNVPLIGGSFYTVIGVIFLVIVLLSPAGLLGIWDQAVQRFQPTPVATAGPTDESPSASHEGTT